MIADHMGQFRDVFAAMKKMYDRAVEHYEREIAAEPRIRSQLATVRAAQQQKVAMEINRFNAQEVAMKATLQHKTDEAAAIEENILLLYDQLDSLREKKTIIDERTAQFDETRDHLQDWDAQKRNEVHQRKTHAKDKAQMIEDCKESMKATKKGLALTLIQMEELKQEILHNKYVDDADIQEARQREKKLQKEKKRLGVQVNMLVDQFEKGLKKQTELETAKQTIKAATDRTPRPDWHQIGEEVKQGFHTSTQGGVDDLLELYNRLRVKKADLMTRIREEGGEADEEDELTEQQNSEFFIGLGFKTSVPACLRFRGRIVQRRMSKRDTVCAIRKIWQSKRKHDKGKKTVQSMGKFLNVYFKETYPVHKIAIEHAYNLIDAVFVHQSDPECEMIRRIIMGDWQEELYKDHVHMLDQLDAMICNLDRNDTGVIPKTRFLAALRAFYHTKNEGDFQVLASALEADSPGPDAFYFNIFGPLHDDAGAAVNGFFLEAVRDQYLEERDLALTLLDEQLDALQAREGEEVSVSSVVSAFRKADPEMSTRLARQFVLRVIDQKEISNTEKINLPRFQAVVRAAPIHRFTAFSQQTCTQRALSPTIREKKSDQGVNANILAFMFSPFRMGPPLYNRQQKPEHVQQHNEAAHRVEDIASQILSST